MRSSIPLGKRLSMAAGTVPPNESVPRTHRLSSQGTLVRRRRSRYGWRPQPRLDDKLLPVLVALGVLVLVALAGGLYAKRSVDTITAEVAADFRSGQAALEAGKAQLKTASAAHDVAGIQKSEGDFAAAEADFRAGAAALDRSRLVGLARALPVVGSFVSPQAEAVDHLAAMGVALSQAASGAAGVDLDLSSPDPHGLKGAPHLLAALQRAQGPLKAIQAEVLAARKDAHEVNPGLLPGSERAAFTKSLGSIDKAASAVVEFNRLVPAIFDILGANGPRTYLIEQVNPAELRSGGGFIGTVSIARADHGKLTVVKSGDSYALEGPRPYQGQPGYVAPPPELGKAFPAAYSQGLSWALADSNVFADPATSARWGEWFAQHSLGVKVDGVIVMDYNAVAGMLSVTGPIHLPGYGVTFTSRNFVRQVLALDLAQTSTHKSVLGAAAQPLLKDVSALQPGQWPALVSVLNAAVTEGHLHAYFDTAVAQNEMVRLGWSRSINPAGARDFVMETEDNFAGSKMNAFLSRSYTVQLTQTAGGLHHKVIVDLYNKAPLSLPGDSTRNYAALVRFYVNSTATHLSLTSPPSPFGPLQPIKTAPRDVPAGLQVIGGYFAMDMNGWTVGHYRVVLQYDTPPAPGATAAASIYWQKQPGVGADAVSISWSVDGHLFKATTDLSQDRVIKLTSSGMSVRPGQEASVHLPSLSL